MYELLYIIPTPFTENEVPQIQEKVNNLIKELGGKIEMSENWGNRKLAYDIKQVKRGFYILNTFTLEPALIKTLDQKLKLVSEVLRFQICKVIPKKEAPPPKEKVKKSELKTLEEELSEI